MGLFDKFKKKPEADTPQWPQPPRADTMCLVLMDRVLEDIDNDTRSGAVFADGKTWTARSADGEVIPAGATVEIVRMEGVKLLVRSQAAVSVLS